MRFIDQVYKLVQIGGKIGEEDVKVNMDVNNLKIVINW